MVSTSRWRDANVLIDIVTHTGARLASAQPNGKRNRKSKPFKILIYPVLELAVGNIVKRVLKVIREVSRGELETDGRDERGEATPDYSSFEEDELEDSDREDNQLNVFKQSSTTSSLAGSIHGRPELTTQASMFRLLADMSTLTVREQKREENEKRIRDTYNLKPLIIQEITEEIVADLDTIYKGIADQALDFIHAK